MPRAKRGNDKVVKSQGLSGANRAMTRTGTANQTDPRNDPRDFCPKEHSPRNGGHIENL